MFIVRPAFIVFALLSLTCLPGCADPRVRDVNNSVDYAKRMLERTKTDPIAMASFASSVEQGGSVTAYLAANMASPDGFAPYVWMGPPAAYTVVIRPGSAPNEYVIEGYAASTDNPSTTQAVTVAGDTR
jgi:hypothetical protein